MHRSNILALITHLLLDLVCQRLDDVLLDLIRSRLRLQPRKQPHQMSSTSARHATFNNALGQHNIGAVR